MSISLSASKGPWSRRFANPTAWLVVLLVALGCYRLSLIGSGHFFYGDEWAYNCAMPLIDHLSAGEYFFGVFELFRPSARPGFVLVSVVPVVLQRVVGSLLSLTPDTLHYYDAAAAYNVGISLCVTVCLYGIGRSWLRSPWYALLFAGAHALLANSNVWVRHMVPYHESLLMGLIALWLLSRQEGSRKRVIVRTFAAGLLSTLAYATYPGFYPFVILNGVVMLAVVPKRIAGAASYAIASASVIGGFEVLARSVGTSYIQDMLHSQERMGLWANASWNAGASQEGYVFIWRYIRDVEGVFGIVLLGLFACGVGLLLWRRSIELPRAARIGIAAAVGCYLLHASAAVLFQKVVFYGRFLALYLPFVVCGAVLTLKHIPTPPIRRVGVCAFVLVSLGSFVLFARQYAALVYPSDFFVHVMANEGLDMPDPRTIRGQTGEFAMIADGRPAGWPPHLVSHEVARTCQARFIAVNFKQLDSPEHYQPFVPPVGYRLLARQLHPNAFPGPGYEAFPPRVRRQYLERQPTMRIYERSAASPTG